MAKFKSPVDGETLQKIEDNTDFDAIQAEYNRRFTEITCQLELIASELQTLNTYMALITNVNIKA